MTKVCTVCGNRASDTDREIVDPLQKITYHKIPINGERNRKWLAFCSLTKNDNINNKFVCSDHFEKQYLQRDLKSELLDGVKRIILTKQAIPTIKKPKKLKRMSSQESEEEERKKRKEEVEKLLNGEIPEPITNPFRQKHVVTKQSRKKLSKSKAKTSSKDPSVNEDQDANTMFENVVKIKSPLKEDMRLKSLGMENRALKLKINELEQLVEKKNEKINLAKTEMVNITIALQELKDVENRNLNARVKELLHGHYTENQIRKIFNSSDSVSWTNEEMQKAFVLRLHGAEIYDYICQDLRYPLPNPTEMLLWVHRIYQQTGFLIPVLSVLQALGRKMSPSEKECILLLGRTKVKMEYHYDSARDQIIGNTGYLYCICVQGIVADWRQIMYVDFDLIYSPDLLLALINELYDVGFNVAGVSGTCDQETLDLWTDFDVSSDKHFICHPKTNQPIYMFTCAISTLSLIRKVFSEDGFLVQGDILVTKDIVQKLYESHNPDILQLLSSTTLDTMLNESTTSEEDTRSSNDMVSVNVVKALRILSEEGEESVSVLATLVELFKDWYEVLTTTSKPADDIDDMHQYEMNIEEQNIVLDGMYDTIESLKCSSEQSSCLQTGVMVSLNSLKKLCADLRNRHDCKFIPTRNLTLYNLNRIFDAFQNIDSSEVQPISRILYQLGQAIVDHDESSMSNKIIKAALLPSGKPEYEEPAAEEEDSSIANISENKALLHLTENIASTLRGKYEYLGDQTFVIERKDNSYVVLPEMPTGILEPSRLWIEQAKKLEKYVSDITFYRKENVIENLVNSISRRHPKMGIDIIRMYVQKRIMIKLKNLNKELQGV